MSEARYLHGYSSAEQRRLVRQAEYWRSSLIPLGLSYGVGECVLEVGCGAGAVLAVLAQTFRGIAIAGIDRQARQVEFARQHLASLGFTHADLRTGDASTLPWADGSFDHVYFMWMLEHLDDPLPVLREAHRVLRPGGRVCITETDYTTFKIHPPSPDYDYLEQAQHDFFAAHGSATIGRQLGNLLERSAFTDVLNAPVGFHFFCGSNAPKLRAHVDYVVEFLGLAIPRLATLLALDESRLQQGLRHLASIPDAADASMTQIIYRAHARKRAKRR